MLINVENVNLRIVFMCRYNIYNIIHTFMIFKSAIFNDLNV